MLLWTTLCMNWLDLAYLWTTLSIDVPFMSAHELSATLYANWHVAYHVVGHRRTNGQGFETGPSGQPLDKNVLWGFVSGRRACRGRDGTPWAS